MRLPNGFGQISKIKNQKLRKPYRVMVTVGKTATGKPISKILKPQGYFATYTDAFTALVEYHKNPYDLTSLQTLEEVYNSWLPEYESGLTNKSTLRGMKAAWNYVNIKQMNMREIRPYHIKDVVLNSDASENTKLRIKSLFNKLFDYALELELVDKNYARNINVRKFIKTKDTSDSHKSFTDEEMSELWSKVGTSVWVDMILVQCYSGWRPNELCHLETKNINDEYMIGGSKTDAGKNRIVPIHQKIASIIRHYYNEDSKYLFNYSYDVYAANFKKICSGHTPHDARKHFVTMAKKRGVDEYAIKYIVGHSISDITERVYTDRNIEWLKTEMQKI